MKILIVVFLGLIVAALGGAGLFMLKHKPDDAEDGARDRRMARALALRVGLSVSLFLLILLAYALGWIHPSGIPISG